MALGKHVAWNHPEADPWAGPRLYPPRGPSGDRLAESGGQPLLSRGGWRVCHGALGTPSGDSEPSPATNPKSV